VKLWPFVVVLVGLVLAGTVYTFVREPQRGDLSPAVWELPRLPVDRVAAPLPPRFAGPLPSDIEGFQQDLEKRPPHSYVRARLLEGDREVGAKFLTALRQTADSAWNLGELWSAYGGVLGAGGYFESDDDKPPENMSFHPGVHDEAVPCQWLRERLSEARAEPPLLTGLLWRKLVRCPGAEATNLFSREDAPPQWVLDHHFLFNRPLLTPALERAVRRILDQNRFELFEEARRWVSESQEPVARELHEELWRRASAEMRAAWEQKAAEREFESRKKQEHPWKCPPIPTRPEGVDSLTVNRCLDEWVASSWAQTARFAMSASRSPELQGHIDAFGTLRNFPSVAAMKAWAVERKLLPEAALALEEDPESISLISVMRQARRAFLIDLRTDTFPRPHDELLVTLAWIARPALAGVVFEQIPPKSPPPSVFEPPSSDLYTLRAYADGQRFSVQAQNSHRLEDIGAVIGLLNQVLEARGSTNRFAVDDTRSSSVYVVFGPEVALREADALGLWRLGDGRQVLAQAEAQLDDSLRKMLGEIPF
jgi:hypothetical protein